MACRLIQPSFSTQNHPSWPLKKVANFRRKNASRDWTALFPIFFTRYAKNVFLSPFVSYFPFDGWSFASTGMCDRQKCLRWFLSTFSPPHKEKTLSWKQGNGKGTKVRKEENTFLGGKIKGTRIGIGPEIQRWVQGSSSQVGTFKLHPSSDKLSSWARISSLTMPEMWRGQFHEKNTTFDSLGEVRNTREFAKWYRNMAT